MTHQEERTLRQQLIEARDNIKAQIDELSLGTDVLGFARRDSPLTNRPLIAELEGQLNEINALLDSA